LRRCDLESTLGIYINDCEQYQLMSMVIHARPMLETLLTSGDFTTALDLAVTTRDLIQTELRGIEAMNESLTHLQKMVKSIARKMTDEFVHVSLTAPYHRTAGQTGLPDKLEQNQLTVVHYFLELLAMRKAPKALSKYREAALKYVKELIRTVSLNLSYNHFLTRVTDDGRSHCHHETIQRTRETNGH
jgi:hypothetical protein